MCLNSRLLSLLLVPLAPVLASCSGEGGHGGSKSSHGSSSASHGGSSSTSGHGSKQAASHNSETAELLDLLEDGGHQDPSRYVEVEIGTFRVTHKLADEGEPLVVKFRLFGVVSESKQEHLHTELARFDKRIRDAVISLVQKTEAEQLAEPGLKWLKAELVSAINRVVQDRALADIAFSDFSLEGV